MFSLFNPIPPGARGEDSFNRQLAGDLKLSRIYAAADIFTLGLWELIASPTELVIRGDKISARAEFDKRDLLREFRILGAEQPAMKGKPHTEGAEQPVRRDMSPGG